MRTFDVTEMPNDVVGVQSCIKRPDINSLNHDHVVSSDFGELYTLAREDVPQLIKALLEFMPQKDIQITEAERQRRVYVELRLDY